MKTWSKEQFIDAIKTSNKYIDVAHKLGLTNLGSNYKTMKKYIKLYDLNISHFLSIKELLKEARLNRKLLTNEEIFCVNLISRRLVRQRVLQENLIEYCCQRCKTVEWEEEKLTLHLDHINGINNDHRLENLRFLCPNCHSLTETYCSRNIKSVIIDKNNCATCNKEIGPYSIHCRKCANKAKTKINWPNHDTLLTMIKESSYTQVGRSLGVSDSTIRKHLRNNVPNSLVGSEELESPLIG